MQLRTLVMGRILQLHFYSRASPDHNRVLTDNITTIGTFTQKVTHSHADMTHRNYTVTDNSDSETVESEKRRQSIHQNRGGGVSLDVSCSRFLLTFHLSEPMSRRESDRALVTTMLGYY